MVEAASQPITWISTAEAERLVGEIYFSKAKGFIYGWLAAKKVRWRCAELKGRRRDCDPGNGDPGFWKREHRGVQLRGRLDENWAHRRETVNQAVLCDYWAFGIEVVQDNLAKLLPNVRIDVRVMLAKTWVTATAKQMKANGEIREGINKTDFAKELARRMALAATSDPTVRPSRFESIRNELENWGLWPVTLI